MKFHMIAWSDGISWESLVSLGFILTLKPRCHGNQTNTCLDDLSQANRPSNAIEIAIHRATPLANYVYSELKFLRNSKQTVGWSYFL